MGKRRRHDVAPLKPPLTPQRIDEIIRADHARLGGQQKIAAEHPMDMQPLQRVLSVDGAHRVTTRIKALQDEMKKDGVWDRASPEVSKIVRDVCNELDALIATASRGGDFGVLEDRCAKIRYYFVQLVKLGAMLSSRITLLEDEKSICEALIAEQPQQSLTAQASKDMHAVYEAYELCVKKARDIKGKEIGPRVFSGMLGLVTELTQLIALHSERAIGVEATANVGSQLRALMERARNMFGAITPLTIHTTTEAIDKLRQEAATICAQEIDAYIQLFNECCESAQKLQQEFQDISRHAELLNGELGFYHEFERRFSVTLWGQVPPQRRNELYMLPATFAELFKDVHACISQFNARRRQCDAIVERLKAHKDTTLKEFDTLTSMLPDPNALHFGAAVEKKIVAALLVSLHKAGKIIARSSLIKSLVAAGIAPDEREGRVFVSDAILALLSEQRLLQHIHDAFDRIKILEKGIFWVEKSVVAVEEHEEQALQMFWQTRYKQSGIRIVNVPVAGTDVLKQHPMYSDVQAVVNALNPSCRLLLTLIGHILTTVATVPAEHIVGVMLYTDTSKNAAQVAGDILKLMIPGAMHCLDIKIDCENTPRCVYYIPTELGVRICAYLAATDPLPAATEILIKEIGSHNRDHIHEIIHKIHEADRCIFSGYTRD